jgi:hypothetical protein
MKKDLIQENFSLIHAVKLPVPGKVLVHLGQKIDRGSVIAEAVLPDRFQVFDVLNHFRIDTRDMEFCIKRLAGEDVQKGDVIARKPGLVSRIFRAPEAGKVVSVRDGRVTLAMGERHLEAVSPIAGVVAEIIPGLGAQIFARGSKLNAAWGNGKIASGSLLLVDQVKNFDQKDLVEKVVVLTNERLLDVMTILEQAGVAGVVVWALDPLQADRFENGSVPLLSLAGFGDSEISSAMIAVLKELEGKTAYLLAHEPFNRDDQKAALFFPVEQNQAMGLFETEQKSLLGSQVRFWGSPYFGSLGEIIEIPDEEERLGSGILSKVVVVRRAEESVIRVPLENLEILSF